MAVYKRTYKVYNGLLTPDWSRFAVLTRYSLSSAFDSRFFTAYYVLCFGFFLLSTCLVYLAHSQIAQTILSMRLEALELDSTAAAIFLMVQTVLGFLLVAAIAPGVVSRDLANQALQLYFSRPLSRTEYIVGKISVLAVLLSGITWIPGLLLFLLQASLAGNGWGWNNLYIAGAIFVSSWLWIAVVSLLGLAVSVYVRWKIVASGLIFAVIFVLPGFGEAFNEILGTHWGKLLDVSLTIRTVWAHLFRLRPQAVGVVFRNEIPLWSAWISIFSVCALSVFLLNRRLKAREVVRG